MTKRLSICINSSPLSKRTRPTLPRCPIGGDSTNTNGDAEDREEYALCYSPSKLSTRRSLGRISVITPFLLLGDDRVQDDDLIKHNVKAIIDCRTLAEQEGRGLVGSTLQLTRLALPIQDNKAEDASRFFYAAVHFIESQKALGGNVFVHCTRGISRSPAVCCAYLIWANSLDCRDALSLLKSRHPTSDPNPSFAMQLVDFALTRLKDTVAFQVSANGRALIGPLSKGEAETLLKSPDGMLLVVSRSEERQFIWCADGRSASKDMVKCMAHVLSNLRCAPQLVVDASTSEPTSEAANEKVIEQSFMQAIESLNH